MISERGWRIRSGEHINLPLLWPGFDSWIWSYALVAVIVGSRPWFVGFSTEPTVLLPRKSQHSHFFYLRSENDQLGESQYESVNRVEAAKLLGSPKSKNDTRFQHRKIVNMLLSTRQIRRWAVSVRSMDVIETQWSFKFLLGRWTLINMTYATDKQTDCCTFASGLDRIMHMTNPEESEIMEYIVI